MPLRLWMTGFAGMGRLAWMRAAGRVVGVRRSLSRRGGLGVDSGSLSLDLMLHGGLGRVGLRLMLRGGGLS